MLLKHAIGLLQPDSGTLRIDGQDFWASNPRQRNRLRSKMGYVFQEGALFDSMTVRDNVAFALRRHSGLPEEKVLERVRECLSLVHLQGTEDRRPSELSTGMRRRVGLARAITMQPEVLLFDEPTAGLDPMLVTVIDRLIRDLSRALAITTITVTHDLRTARTVGQRIALLSRGVLVADAPADRSSSSITPASASWSTGIPRARCSQPRSAPRWGGEDEQRPQGRSAGRGRACCSWPSSSCGSTAPAGTGRRRQLYSVWLPDAQGLDDKAPVLLKGVRVGRVTGLDLSGEGVRAEILVTERVQLREGTRASVSSVGLLGREAAGPGAGEGRSTSARARSPDSRASRRPPWTRSSGPSGTSGEDVKAVTSTVRRVGRQRADRGEGAGGPRQPGATLRPAGEGRAREPGGDHPHGGGHPPAERGRRSAGHAGERARGRARRATSSRASTSWGRWPASSGSPATTWRRSRSGSWTGRARWDTGCRATRPPSGWTRRSPPCSPPASGSAPPWGAFPRGYADLSVRGDYLFEQDVVKSFLQLDLSPDGKAFGRFQLVTEPFGEAHASAPPARPPTRPGRPSPPASRPATR